MRRMKKKIIDFHVVWFLYIDFFINVDFNPYLIADYMIVNILLFHMEFSVQHGFLFWSNQ